MQRPYDVSAMLSAGRIIRIVVLLSACSLVAVVALLLPVQSVNASSGGARSFVWWTDDWMPSQVLTHPVYMPMVGRNSWTGQANQWRFGYAVHSRRGAIEDYDAAQLYAGWYYDLAWRVRPSRPNGIEYIQVIRVGDKYPPSWDDLARAIANNRGAWWFVGNEPDRAVHQDSVVPTVYAQRYHEIYQFIKAQDATARVAPAGIVQPTPLRLRYLDSILAEYRSRYGVPMPADGWNIHNMILREEANSWGAGIPPGVDATQGVLYDVQDNDNIAYFRDQIVAFRQWMKANGYQALPLMISEYGILMPAEYGFGAQRVINFMYASFLYMLDARDCSLGMPGDDCRLVQRWSWYSLNDQMYVPPPACIGNDCGFNGNLFDPATRLITAFGIAYRDRPYR